MNPMKMPGEYAAINDLDGPDDFTPADVVATAAVAGAIFGVGGGEELNSALALEAARKRFGRRKGERVWRDFRSVDDPEATAIVHGKRFPYARHPRRPARPRAARWRHGRVRRDRREGGGAGREHAQAALVPERGIERAARVRARVRSPAIRSWSSARRPPISRPRCWSSRTCMPPATTPAASRSPGSTSSSSSATAATTRGAQRRPRRTSWTRSRFRCATSTHYRFRGRCREIEVLERTNEWSPNAADPTPAGSETLQDRAHRARHRDRARRGEGQACALHAPAQHIRARDRLGPCLLAPQRPARDPGPARLPACRGARAVHVQLVLRRLRAHRVPERRREPDPRTRRGREPADARTQALPVAPLGSRRDDAAVAHRQLDPWAQAPARHRPAVPHRLERQAGARLRRRRRQLGLRARLPLEAAGRSHPPARARIAQGDAAGAGRGDGGRGDRGPARRCRAAVAPPGPSR